MKACIIILYTFLLVISFPIQAQKQGICGKVSWISGNQMPGPDKEAEQPVGVERMIYVHEATNPEQTVPGENGLYSRITSRLITQVTSKHDGSFRISLPEGEYSIFVKEAEGWFANGFDNQGRIQVVRVEPRKYTEINILVNYLASY